MVVLFVVEIRIRSVAATNGGYNSQALLSVQSWNEERIGHLDVYPNLVTGS